MKKILIMAISSLLLAIIVGGCTQKTSTTKNKLPGPAPSDVSNAALPLPPAPPAPPLAPVTGDNPAVPVAANNPDISQAEKDQLKKDLESIKSLGSDLGKMESSVSGLEEDQDL